MVGYCTSSWGGGQGRRKGTLRANRGGGRDGDAKGQRAWCVCVWGGGVKGVEVREGGKGEGC